MSTYIYLSEPSQLTVRLRKLELSFLPLLFLVAHASLFIQNISVTVCSIVLMLVFSYKQWIEQIWDGWLTVSTFHP